MMIEVDGGLEDYVASHSGGAHFELRGSGDSDVGKTAMQAAREALFGIPHPEEPGDALPSFASEVEVGERGPSFWVDIADAEAYDGLIAQVVSVVASALESAGATGNLTWPEAP